MLIGGCGAAQTWCGKGIAKKILNESVWRGFCVVLFWEREDLRWIPPSPSDLWNHWVRGKTQSNLWGSSSCGQNLLNKELMSFAAARSHTATAFTMTCSLVFERKVRCHNRLWISREIARSPAHKKQSSRNLSRARYILETLLNFCRVTQMLAPSKATPAEDELWG
jgi:hypothetical protein